MFLLNDYIGELGSGGVLEVDAEVGMHLLSFNRSTLKKIGKDTTFTVVVNESDEIVELYTSFDADGNYIVKYADNKPHIPVGVNAINNQPQNIGGYKDNTEDTAIVTQAPGIRCPRCGSHDIMPVSEVSTKGKDFNTGDACCGYMLCGPLGLLCGATGKGKQTTTTTYWMCKGCGNKFKV